MNNFWKCICIYLLQYVHENHRLSEMLCFPLYPSDTAQLCLQNVAFFKQLKVIWHLQSGETLKLDMLINFIFHRELHSSHVFSHCPYRQCLSLHLLSSTVSQYQMSLLSQDPSCLTPEKQFSCSVMINKDQNESK